MNLEKKKFQVVLYPKRHFNQKIIRVKIISDNWKEELYIWFKIPQIQNNIISNKVKGR